MQVKLTRFPTVGLYLEYDLYSIPVESGWGSRGRDHMVVGFTTIYAISAHNH
jgi:hypothetical protein